MLVATGKWHDFPSSWYANPILAWLEVLLDFPCLEQGSLDLAYLTEVDPLWNDDELTLILNPEAVLFANPTQIGSEVARVLDAFASRPAVQRGLLIPARG